MLVGYRECIRISAEWLQRYADESECGYKLAIMNELIHIGFERIGASKA
jgi:hypothetical protein